MSYSTKRNERNFTIGALDSDPIAQNRQAVELTLGAQSRQFSLPLHCIH